MAREYRNLEKWFEYQAELKSTALSIEEINELKLGDVIRVHRPASVIPGNDSVDVEGPIEEIANYGSDQVIAVSVAGCYFDRAGSYFYRPTT